MTFPPAELERCKLRTSGPSLLLSLHLGDAYHVAAAHHLATLSAEAAPPPVPSFQRVSSQPSFLNFCWASVGEDPGGWRVVLRVSPGTEVMRRRGASRSVLHPSGSVPPSGCFSLHDCHPCTPTPLCPLPHRLPCDNHRGAWPQTWQPRPPETVSPCPAACTYAGWDYQPLLNLPFIFQGHAFAHPSSPHKMHPAPHQSTEILICPLLRCCLCSDAGLAPLSSGASSCSGCPGPRPALPQALVLQGYVAGVRGSGVHYTSTHLTCLPGSGASKGRGCVFRLSPPT